MYLAGKQRERQAYTILYKIQENLIFSSVLHHPTQATMS